MLVNPQDTPETPYDTIYQFVLHLHKIFTISTLDTGNVRMINIENTCTGKQQNLGLLGGGLVT